MSTVWYHLSERLKLEIVMGSMKELKFTDEVIANSFEVQNWLKQFDLDDINKIVQALKQLRVIEISEFRKFIKNTLLLLESDAAKNQVYIAIYPVRKFKKNDKLWVSDNQSFKIIERTPQGNGSEDLVIATINDLCKSNTSYLIESPRLDILKERKIQKIIFVVDSSISGDQVNEFINRFFENKTIKSYWSLKYFEIKILSFFLTEKAKKKILNNYFLRKRIRKDNSAVSFDYILNDVGLDCWEEDLINKVLPKYTAIPKKMRLGFDDSGSNIVFEHSVPNNIFGIFYYKTDNDKKKWIPLFPNRRIPDDLLSMLKNKQPKRISELPSTHLKILSIIGRGKKTIYSISKKSGYAELYINKICQFLLKIKFIKLSKSNNYYFLDKMGKEFLEKNTKQLEELRIDNFNFEIYAPAMKRSRLTYISKSEKVPSSCYCVSDNGEW